MTIYHDDPTAGSNSRSFKRFARKTGMTDPVYEAYQAGQAFAEYGRFMPPRLRRNPYPAGRRHSAWLDGFNLADPMGEWMGRNV